MVWTPQTASRRRPCHFPPSPIREQAVSPLTVGFWLIPHQSSLEIVRWKIIDPGSPLKFSLRLLSPFLVDRRAFYHPLKSGMNMAYVGNVCDSPNTRAPPDMPAEQATHTFDMEDADDIDDSYSPNHGFTVNDKKDMG